MPPDRTLAQMQRELGASSASGGGGGGGGSGGGGGGGSGGGGGGWSALKLMRRRPRQGAAAAVRLVAIEELSEGATELMVRLCEPTPADRMGVAAAREHAWLSGEAGRNLLASPRC